MSRAGPSLFHKYHFHARSSAKCASHDSLIIGEIVDIYHVSEHELDKHGLLKKDGEHIECL